MKTTPLTELEAHAQIRLALLGLRPAEAASSSDVLDLVAPLIARQRQSERLLSSYLCPVDQRLQSFLYDFFEDQNVPRLPRHTLVLDRPGLARLLSLPKHRDDYTSPYVRSYRIRQGVLHNPSADRRTTQGVFHVAQGGLPVPDDKVEVPRPIFARLLQAALQPPDDLLLLPYTADWPNSARCWVSLFLRPLVCPAVPGFTGEQRMETRFLAPGSLVSNLDFVEAIFGNAGDPHLPECDAGLDVEGWSGQTGGVILAPHLTRLSKRELGLPPWDLATQRQQRDGMCWRSRDELYNGGSAFKITARDATGVILTVIADNYFGYCKKEVKTQISFAANLHGLCEEEHAGGALVYPSYDLGESYSGEFHVKGRGHTFEQAVARHGSELEVHPDGYATVRAYPDLVLVREDATFDLRGQRVEWQREGRRCSLKLLPTRTYIRPSGYRVTMTKPPGQRSWRLVGTVPEPTLCHKPCTVSGGGKSEISKPIDDAILQGPVFVADFQRDFDRVEELLARDYADRFLDPARRGQDQRPILGPERSLGSVIKLLTPSDQDYTAEFNAWLGGIPQHVKELVFVVKRFHQPSWGQRWRERFSVDFRDGRPGNELKLDGRTLVSNYLRVGFAADGSWRVFGLRKDFSPSEKIQVEDDITASVVVPASRLAHLNPADPHPAVKFVANVEQMLFQRPDDAIVRGSDRQAEADLAGPGVFVSNFEPLTQADAVALVEDAIGFQQFTEPMQALVRRAAAGGSPAYFVSSAHPRLVDGKPSKNPRYQQPRPDLLMPREVWLAAFCTRLARRIPPNQPAHTPVNAVIPGRRNNPPEPGVRPLAVHNPIHYLELPEAFMEFISSMTGKSPSTTGAGSEGALTKGPFNALPPIIDLNNALLSFVLTGYPVFLSAAGYVGPRVRVAHDISLLIPELWCRLTPAERDPARLIAQGHFERCQDFIHGGRQVLASRLGYRMTAAFARQYFGRIFNCPHEVFPEEMLKPERQDPDVFAEGIENMVETHRRTAESYFQDGSVDLASPPLRALLHIMRDGHCEGRGVEDPEIRRLFTREHLLASSWYAERLSAQQELDVRLWRQHVRYLEGFLSQAAQADEAARLGIRERLVLARQRQAEAADPARLTSLAGTLGRQVLPVSPPAP